IVSVLVILQAREKTGFTQSVDLNQLKIRQKLPRPVNEPRRHRRSAISQHLEAAQVVLFSFWRLGQQIDHCRHQNGVTYSFPFDSLSKDLPAEFGNGYLTRAKHRNREHRGKV